MVGALPILPPDSSPEAQRRFELALSTQTQDAAPIDAEYWVSTANLTLTNERNIGGLTTGYLKITTAVGIATPSTVASIPGGDITGQALTRTNDTNITLTLSGTPSTALLNAVSMTLGWLGTLATARGGTSVDIASAALPLGSGQVTFPATQNPSTNANTLDDYEEGTWTATDGSGAALTFTPTFTPTYGKIGKWVFVTCALSYPSTANGSAAKIAGLPFTTDNNQAGLTVGYIAALGYVPTVFTNPSAQTFQFTNPATGSLLTNANLSSIAMVLSGWYQATQ